MTTTSKTTKSGITTTTLAVESREDDALLKSLTTAGNAYARSAHNLAAAILEAFQGGIDRSEIKDHLLSTTTLAPSTVGQLVSTTLCASGKRQRKAQSKTAKNELADVVILWLMSEKGCTFKEAKSAALSASRLKEEPIAEATIENGAADIVDIAAAA